MTDRNRPDEETGDEIDTFPRPGTRSDQAGSGGSVAGPSPAAGGDAGETRSEPHVPGGQGTGAGGGFGTGSGQSSGGTGEGEYPAGDDPETDWLRDAPGGPGDAA
ncbi:MAG: hypothetical protein ACJ769_06730 [Chloroflexota bacterium]